MSAAMPLATAVVGDRPGDALKAPFDPKARDAFAKALAASTDEKAPATPGAKASKAGPDLPATKDDDAPSSEPSSKLVDPRALLAPIAAPIPPAASPLPAATMHSDASTSSGDGPRAVAGPDRNATAMFDGRIAEALHDMVAGPIATRTASAAATETETETATATATATETEDVVRIGGEKPAAARSTFARTLRARSSELEPRSGRGANEASAPEVQEDASTPGGARTSRDTPGREVAANDGANANGGPGAASDAIDPRAESSQASRSNAAPDASNGNAPARADEPATGAAPVKAGVAKGDPQAIRTTGRDASRRSVGAERGPSPSPQTIDAEPRRADAAPDATAADATTGARSDEATEALARRQHIADGFANRLTLRKGAHAEADLAELGRISVDAHARGDHVDVKVVAERAHLADAIQAQRPELESALKAADVKVGSLDIGTQKRGDSGSQGDSERREGAPAGTPAVSASTLPTPATAALPGRVRIVL